MKSQKKNNTENTGELHYSHKKNDELLYYGLHICETIAKNNPEKIIKIYMTKHISRQFSSLLKYCAQNKKVYKIVENEELEKITDSVHHEGIALIASYKQNGNLNDLINEIKIEPRPIVYIDGVSNPHNVGTLMRIMANFNFKYLVGGSTTPELSAASARMSEGGCEFIKTFKCTNHETFIKAVKENGYTIIGTSSHTTKSIYSYNFPKKSVIIMGHEVTGMSKEMLKAADCLINIPGTGFVESLNVSTAASIFMSEYYKIHGIS
jgi:RNA methyltransferase, TrmH family